MALRLVLVFLSLLSITTLIGQEDFYFGVDLSYVNEVEDCGQSYAVAGTPRDPYAIFAEAGMDMVRLRLWHTPSWYDTLNAGQRYGDLADVQRSIRRAKEAGMKVLLDFHLSDTWADPGSQLVPAAWLPVVEDVALLADSLHHYVYGTLSRLRSVGLQPDWVQLGNETNKGILLSPEDNDTWTLDWSRNAQLFRAAIQAVADFESQWQTEVGTILHFAGPAEVEWLVAGFAENGIVDYDFIGISYYWTWHQPDGPRELGQVVRRLRQAHPAQRVLLLETAYPWTAAWQDEANNIIQGTHPDFTPASPETQRDWLIELSQMLLREGGSGLFYWEPAWLSTDCRTPWGRGSHFENATFFDFSGELLQPGGIDWPRYDYDRTPTGTVAVEGAGEWIHWLEGNQLQLRWPGAEVAHRELALYDAYGRLCGEWRSEGGTSSFSLAHLPAGLYHLRMRNLGGMPQRRTFFYQP